MIDKRCVVLSCTPCSSCRSRANSCLLLLASTFPLTHSQRRISLVRSRLMNGTMLPHLHCHHLHHLPRTRTALPLSSHRHPHGDHHDLTPCDTCPRLLFPLLHLRQPHLHLPRHIVQQKHWRVPACVQCDPLTRFNHPTTSRSIHLVSLASVLVFGSVARDWLPPASSAAWTIPPSLLLLLLLPLLLLPPPRLLRRHHLLSVRILRAVLRNSMKLVNMRCSTVHSTLLLAGSSMRRCCRTHR